SLRGDTARAADCPSAFLCQAGDGIRGLIVTGVQTCALPILRPTHTNTSWDAAKFEICAHRWIHVGEPGYGIAVVNDSTYGHDVRSEERRVGKERRTRATRAQRNKKDRLVGAGSN